LNNFLKLLIFAALTMASIKESFNLENSICTTIGEDMSKDKNGWPYKTFSPLLLPIRSILPPLAQETSKWKGKTYMDFIDMIDDV
jgi:hypothetical protein